MTDDQQRLNKKIEDLEKKIDHYSSPYEDVLATNVYLESQKKFKTWISGWLAIATLILIFFGFKGYNDVITYGRERATTFVKSKSFSDLQALINKDLDSLKMDFKKKLKENTLKYNSEFDKELAQLISDAQTTVDERFNTFAEKVGAAIKSDKLVKQIQEKKPRISHLKAYAYYGIWDGKGWTEANFTHTSGNKKRFPQKGDIVRARVPINARDGIIEYSAQRGWYNYKKVGLINTNEKLKILEVKKVLGSFIWIKFEKITF